MSNVGVSAKYIKKGLEVVEYAKDKGVPLRLMGCCAVKIHCPSWSQFHETVMKRHATDLDFVTLSKYRKKLREILKELGYDLMKLMRPLDRRDLFQDKDKVKVDIFLDKLEMCHVIDFTHRLQVDYPTISLADLMLEKMQIVEINEKDVNDVIILLLEHEIGDSDAETINSGYIAKLLSKDWGFYYTLTRNLKFIKDSFVDKWKGTLSDENIAEVKTKINELLDRIEKERLWVGKSERL